MSLESMSPEILSWLSDRSFGPDIVCAFGEMKIKDIDSLSKYDESHLIGQLREIGIKAVPAKKVLNAVRDWRSQVLTVETASLVVDSPVLQVNQSLSAGDDGAPVDSTIIDAEASATAAVLKQQLQIESRYIERINFFLVAEARSRMTPKALTVLKFSKADHQSRMQRLKQTIHNKMSTGSESDDNVTESKQVQTSSRSVRFAPLLVRNHHILINHSSPDSKSPIANPPSSSSARRLSAGSGLAAVRQLEAQRIAEQEAASQQQRLDLLQLPGNWECPMCKFINQAASPSSTSRQCQSCFTAKPLVASVRVPGYHLMSQPSYQQQPKQQLSHNAPTLPAVITHKPHAPTVGAPSGLRRSQMQPRPVLLQSAPVAQNNQVFPSVAIRAGRPPLL